MTLNIIWTTWPNKNMMKVVSVASFPAADFTAGNADPNVNETDEKINARMRVLFAKQ